MPPPDDAALVASARLLRRLHDETSRFVSLRDGWQHPPREPVEVLLHGDFAPYNIVFRDGLPAGVFDWDSAHPGPRWWDVSWALVQFVLALPDDRERRTRLFCETYGIEYDPEHVLIRLDDMIRTIREHPAFEIQRAEGHVGHYLDLIRYVEGSRA